jgi:hypothetical protein
MIKLRCLRWGDYPGLLERALNRITSALIKGRGGECHKPINAGSYQRLEEVTKVCFLTTCENSAALPTSSFWLSKYWFWVSCTQNCEKINFCCFKASDVQQLLHHQ